MLNSYVILPEGTHHCFHLFHFQFPACLVIQAIDVLGEDPFQEALLFQELPRRDGGTARHGETV